MKYYRWAISHIREKTSSHIIIILELYIAIIGLSAFWTGIQEYMEAKKFYNNLNCSNLVAIDGDKKTEELINKWMMQDSQLKYLGETKYMVDMHGIVNEDIGAYPITKEFLEYVNYSIKGGSASLIKNNLNDNIMFISKKLSSTYKVGEKYNIRVSKDFDDERMIEVYIGGIIKDDFIFNPDKGLDFIEKINDKCLLYFGKDKEILTESDSIAAFKDETYRQFVLYVEDKEIITQICKTAEQKEGVTRAYSIESLEKKYNAYHKADLGVPLIMSIVIIFMSVTSFTSYVLLESRRREKEYAVLYMCGIEWKECVYIEGIEYLITLIFPIIAALITMYGYEKYLGEQSFSIQGIMLSILLCSNVIIITSMINIIKLSKKSPIVIIKRWL